jgi:hypothetical protein
LQNLLSTRNRNVREDVQGLPPSASATLPSLIKEEFKYWYDVLHESLTEKDNLLNKIRRLEKEIERLERNTYTTMSYIREGEVRKSIKDIHRKLIDMECVYDELPKRMSYISWFETLTLGEMKSELIRLDGRRGKIYCDMIGI